MKKMVIYYSLEGNTKLIGDAIAEEIGADVLEIKPEKEISKGFSKYIWGGRQVTMKERPNLLPLNLNPEDYDTIFIGTPVWAWTYTPPIASLINNIKLTNKKIALFCTCAGSSLKTLSNLKNDLQGNEFIGESEYKNPSKKPLESVEKAKLWAKDIISKLVE